MSDVDWEKLRAPLQPPTEPTPAYLPPPATAPSTLPPPPPVPPPAARPVPPGQPEPVRRRPQLVWAVLAAMIAVLLVLGGYVVARSIDKDPKAAAPAIINPASIDEPAAAVAAVVGPSVVQIETQSGLGSGVVYDDEGRVLTAAHVVAGASTVRVRLADGTAKQGQVLGADDATDVAVVKIDGGQVKAATLALGVALQVGQLAIAVGSPFGLDQSVTMGIVSHLERATQTPGGAIPMVQTDAAINPGNSGGALADKEGRIIGINDAIATGGGSETNAGVGFAIPIDLAKAVADKIVSGQPVEFAFLGVSTSASTTANSDGALIVDVQSGTPADQAGLKQGDTVVAVDGTPIRSQVDLTAKIRSRRPGDVVKLQVRHDDGSEAEVTVTLGSTRTK